MGENTVTQHEGNCRPVLELLIKVDYLEKELKETKESNIDTVAKVTAVALDNATLKATVDSIRDDIKKIGAQFNKAQWWIIGMFGSILVASVTILLKK